MDAKSQLKVIRAGFKIIRTDDQPSLRIKVKKRGSHEWTTLEKNFPSKAARDRRFNELLEDKNVISD
jgi:hypothetical protein